MPKRGVNGSGKNDLLEATISYAYMQLKHSLLLQVTGQKT